MCRGDVDSIDSRMQGIMTLLQATAQTNALHGQLLPCHDPLLQSILQVFCL